MLNRRRRAERAAAPEPARILSGDRPTYPAGEGLSRRRYDTFFLRLFVLMWVTLVVSHAAAYFTVVAFTRSQHPPLAGRPGPGPGRDMPMPTFPSLPPGNPFEGQHPMRPDGPGFDGPRPFDEADPDDDFPRGPGGLAGRWLWIDYGVRLLVMALGAALGACWLAAPMRRVSAAAGSLSESFGRGTPPPGIPEHRGSVEVRATARAFNAMAERLQQQYDARGLQMASVSHDLRTPLARLRLRLEKLADDAVARRAVVDIHEMDEMIAGTLAVLREQQEGVDTRVVDVVALLQSLVDDAVEQGQDVRFEDAPPTRVRARPAALRRIVGNVLGNAVRYGGRARIALQSDAGRVRVTIDDDGPGIPEAQIARAFEPWVRLGAEADEPHARAGHGLGLAIARDLAQRDGGDVHLANRAEGGLRVTVSLVAA